jgi:hypothetical protein
MVAAMHKRTDLLISALHSMQSFADRLRFALSSSWSALLLTEVEVDDEEMDGLEIVEAVEETEG